ncbi:PilS N terminal [Pseudomonas asturiensis]|uniref:PilS N terminal n=1 Tax=Pseudomonas asturiensis TaxID=1190415 RepID=A0A1M7P7I0_9PSED|nr:type 4 pilus major pilin [Pseudomonas asturiensis]SHN12631.1 PilS N terminal [Pseudomonas asturiensis]
MKTRASQYGFIDLSMIFVLICIAVGVGYAMYNGGSLLGSSDVNNEQSNIGMLIANTHKLKGSSGYGASGTNLVPQLAAAKGLPNMTYSGGTLYNSWSGSVSVVSAGMSFVITQNGLPQDACVSLATKIGRGQKVSTSLNGGTSSSGEIDSATAAASCTDGNTNSVAWTSN